MKFNFCKLTLVSVAVLSFNHADAKNTEPYIEHEERQESINNAIGFGTGAVIGGAIAGPPGAIIAGLIGSLIGDDVNDHKKLDLISDSLTRSQSELEKAQLALEQTKKQRDIQISKLEDVILNLQETTSTFPEIIANVQFETGSYLIEEPYQSQLDVIAEQLLIRPDLTVRLSGFADQRGEAEYNQLLSEQRNEAVKAYLIDKNIKESQIVTNAYGESNLAHQSGEYEKLFFDRRVSIQLTAQDKAGMSAAKSMQK